MVLDLFKREKPTYWTDEGLEQERLHLMPGTAFAILANLSHDDSVKTRDALRAAKTVETVSFLLKHDNVFGLLALLIVANIEGMEEKKSRASPEHMKRLCDLLKHVQEDASGAETYNMVWSLQELLLPLKNLSLSEANKHHLIPAVPTLLTILGRYDERKLMDATALAAETLVSLSFEPSVRQLLKEADARQVVEEVAGQDINKAL